MYDEPTTNASFVNPYAVAAPPNPSPYNVSPPQNEDAFDDTGNDPVVDYSDDEDDTEEDSAPVDPVIAAPNPRGLHTKRIGQDYVGEQNNSRAVRGDPWAYNEVAGKKDITFNRTVTDYYSPEKQEQLDVQVKDGLLQRGGELLDTSAASGYGTYRNVGAGKHIFAMTPDEKVRSADAWAMHSETPDNADETARIRQRARALGKEQDIAQSHTLGFVNHSSLVARPTEGGNLAAGEAAAAGELTVDKGKLIQVSDASGHYKPDNTMTNQALQHFEREGVDMHDVGVKLTPKHGELNNDSEFSGDRFLHASARELMSYDGAADAEDQMRARRQEMSSGISSAVRQREERAAQGEMRMGGANVAATPELLDPRANVALPNINTPGNFMERFEGASTVSAPRRAREPIPAAARGTKDVAKLFEGMF